MTAPGLARVSARRRERTGDDRGIQAASPASSVASETQRGEAGASRTQMKGYRGSRTGGLLLPGPWTSALQPRRAWGGSSLDEGTVRCQPVAVCSVCAVSPAGSPDSASPTAHSPSADRYRRSGFQRGRAPRLCSRPSLHLTLRTGQWTAAESPDLPARRRITPGTPTGAQTPRAPAPRFRHSAPSQGGLPRGPGSSPPLPLATPRLPRCAHQDSAPLRCGRGWQAHQERVGWARGGGNGMRGRSARS